eukprot:496640-Prorocentrum_minimum.AAC.2
MAARSSRGSLRGDPLLSVTNLPTERLMSGVCVVSVAHVVRVFGSDLHTRAQTSCVPTCTKLGRFNRHAAVCLQALVPGADGHGYCTAYAVLRAYIMYEVVDATTGASRLPVVPPPHPYLGCSSKGSLK